MMDGSIHNPGGKVKLALPKGMRAGATFCLYDGTTGDTHRPMLWREWGAPGSRYAFFIGMNPSTASVLVDDPTIRREVGFCMRWGLTAYRKANVSDYRATNPKDLRYAKALSSPANIPGILAAARDADRVVLAFGTLSKLMLQQAQEVVARLRAAEIPLLCLGTTADGSPRHPLYLRSDSELQPWLGWKVADAQ